MTHSSERELFWIIGQVINAGLRRLFKAEKIRQISDQYLSLNISLSCFSNNPSSLALQINFSRLGIHIIMKTLETVSNSPLCQADKPFLLYQKTCLNATELHVVFLCIIGCDLQQQNQRNHGPHAVHSSKLLLSTQLLLLY